MDEPLLYRFGVWLCKKINHPFPRAAWIYDGYYHRDCRWCGRVVSEPLKEKNT